MVAKRLNSLVLLLSWSHVFLMHFILLIQPVEAIRNQQQQGQHQQQQQQQQSTYKPRMISSELCRYITSTQCEELDAAFGAQALKLREIQRVAGFVKVLVIPMYWQGHSAQGRLLEPEKVDEIWNADGTAARIPTGSIANWTYTNSYGSLTIEAVVTDAVEADNTEQYYADGRSGLPQDGNPISVVNSFISVMNAVQTAGTIDFTEFDRDGDDKLDVVVFLHSGYPAENGGTDEFGVNSDNRIASFASNAQGAWTSSSNKELANFALAGYYRGTTNRRISRIGLWTHEFIHTFGIPDLYDRDGSYQNNGSIGGLAGFDIMANLAGQSNSQAYPGFLSPWSKLELGWTTPIDITQDGVYFARASQLYHDIHRIGSPIYPDGEYLLIENRQPLLWDSEIWSDGILIYHVDDTTGTSGNFNRGFPGQDGWPGNGNHYRVALLQADGNYELEKATSNGDAEDFWAPGMSLGPGNGEPVALIADYPNTDAYSGGNIQVTGITISDFVEIEEGVWSFTVSGIGTPDPRDAGADEITRYNVQDTVSSQPILRSESQTQDRTETTRTSHVRGQQSSNRGE